MKDDVPEGSGDAAEGGGEERPAAEPENVLDTRRMTPAEREATVTAARRRAAAPPPPPRARAPLALWTIASLALLVAAASLLGNLLMLQLLLERRAAVQSVLDEGTAMIEAAAAEGFSLDFPVSETIEFAGDIPIDQEFDFPIDTVVRINTVASVPINLGALGTINVDVPIDTSVPVKMSVPVHVQQTIHIETEVPIEMTVPVRLPADQPPLSDLIAQARAMLDRLAAVIG